jgi:hypothetical protein
MKNGRKKIHLRHRNIQKSKKSEWNSSVLNQKIIRWNKNKNPNQKKIILEKMNRIKKELIKNLKRKFQQKSSNIHYKTQLKIPIQHPRICWQLCRSSTVLLKSRWEVKAILE